MKKFKNFSQLITFSARSLLKNDDISKETERLMRELHTNTDKQKAKELELDVISSLSEETSKYFDLVGAKIPSDIVEVEVRFGDFLFDIFLAAETRPQAPLALQVFNKRMQDLATNLERESFDLDDNFLATIKSALESDEAWSKLSFNSFIKNGDNQVILTLTSQGINFYPKILQGAIDMFLEPVDEAK